MTAVNLNRAIRGPVTAVPIVAGKGVRLVADTQNNRWVVEADETTLYETTTGETTIQLSESLLNFDRVRFKIKTDQGYAFVERQISTGSNLVIGWSEGYASAWLVNMLLTYNSTTHILTVNHVKMISTSFTSNSATLSAQLDQSGQMNSIREIVGINRIATP